MRPLDSFLWLFSPRPPMLGVVHLAPLPGAPRYQGSLDAVLKQALADTDAFAPAGVDGLIVKNFNDNSSPPKPPSRTR